MASIHKGYRLEESLVEQIATWAEQNGVSETEAVRRLLAMGLEEGGSSPPTQTEAVNGDVALLEERLRSSEQMRAVLVDNVLDLRAEVATLTAQVSEKDVMLRRIADIADHAQVLQATQAAGVAGVLTGSAGESGSVDIGVQHRSTERPTLAERIRRWLSGSER